ncbi:LOW QUALITY PROTEIN: predicted protein, partial [Brucella melitensis bv. 3 str. Ether]
MFVAFSNAKPFRNFAGNALNAMNPEPVMNRLDPVPATVERKAHGAPEHDRFCAPCSTACMADGEARIVWEVRSVNGKGL